jgi:hypothetical protein
MHHFPPPAHLKMRVGKVMGKAAGHSMCYNVSQKFNDTHMLKISCMYTHLVKHIHMYSHLHSDYGIAACLLISYSAATKQKGY